MNLITMLVAFGMSAILALAVVNINASAVKATTTQDIRTDINTYLVEQQNLGKLPIAGVYPYGQKRWYVKNVLTSSGDTYIVFKINADVNGSNIIRRPFAIMSDDIKKASAGGCGGK